MGVYGCVWEIWQVELAGSEVDENPLGGSVPPYIKKIPSSSMRFFPFFGAESRQKRK